MLSFAQVVDSLHFQCRNTWLTYYGFSSSGGAGRLLSEILSGSFSVQIAIGLGDPKMAEWPRLSYVTRGSKKLAAAKQRLRLPITPSILRQLKVVWEVIKDSFNGCMLWAAACMCFLGFSEQER